ncbi:MAG: hypothetical protein HYV09_41540, partial [Deltaproteobacteria bacterium]|nr:hypothetical protein [Deltaproteobacteria bacterium]
MTASSDGVFQSSRAASAFVAEVRARVDQRLDAILRDAEARAAHAGDEPRA